MHFDGSLPLKSATSFSRVCPASLRRQICGSRHCPARLAIGDGTVAAPLVELADFWKNLNYDEHRDIPIQMESGLWAKEKERYSINFWDPGWTTEKNGDPHEVKGGKSEPLKLTRVCSTTGKRSPPELRRHRLCRVAGAHTFEHGGRHGRVPGVHGRELFPGDPEGRALRAFRARTFDQQRAAGRAGGVSRFFGVLSGKTGEGFEKLSR